MPAMLTTMAHYLVAVLGQGTESAGLTYLPWKFVEALNSFSQTVVSGTQRVPQQSAASTVMELPRLMLLKMMLQHSYKYLGACDAVVCRGGWLVSSALGVSSFPLVWLGRLAEQEWSYH